MPLGVYLLFGLVAFLVVFVGIKMVKDNRAEAARIEAKKKADAEADAAYQKLLADTQAADLKRIQEVMAGTSPNQGPRPGHWDTNLVKQPPRGWVMGSSQDGYQQFRSPGTTYHMDKYGGMHQR